MAKKKNEKSGIEALVESGNLKKGSDEDFVVKKISFGIKPLDDLLGGGIPKKRVTIFQGPRSSGKSYLASQLAKKVQEVGGQVVWIDSEMSYDREWVKQCGVNVENLYVVQPESGEAAFNILRAVLIAGVDLVVLDSIAGLAPTSSMEEDFSHNPIAAQARMVNQAFPRFFPHLKNGSALVMINQTRSALGPVSMDPMPGGVAQEFFSHIILSLRRQGWIEEEKVRVGFDIEVRCRKTKAGGKLEQACIIPFRMEGGIDLLETTVREAINKKIIKQAGPWYRIEGMDKNFLGLNEVRDYLKTSGELLKAIEKEIWI